MRQGWQDSPDAAQKALRKRYLYPQSDEIVAALVGGAIFVADSITATDGVASVLYIAILVYFAERWRARSIIGFAVLAACLTLSTYPVQHGWPLAVDPVVRRLVTLAAIMIATGFVARSNAASMALNVQGALLNLTDHAIIVTDLGGRISHWNRAAEQIYQWPAREAMGQALDILLRTSYPVSAEKRDRALETDGYWSGDIVQYARDGTRLVIDSRCMAHLNESGMRIGTLNSGADVTRFRTAIEQLRTSEARYKSIFDSLGVAIFHEDYIDVYQRIEGLRRAGVSNFRDYFAQHPEFVTQCVRAVKIVDVNPRAVTMYEASRREELLASLESIYLPGTSGSFIKIMIAIAYGYRTCESTTRVRTLKGKDMTILMSVTLPANPLEFDTVLVSTLDVTERQLVQDALSRAKDDLRQITQAATLGELSGAIAHEINHPIAATIANSEATMRWINRTQPNRHEAIEAMEAALEASRRAAQVISYIQGAAKGQVTRKAPTALEDMLEQASALLDSELHRHGIELSKQIEPDLPPILCDRIQIEQVIINLLTNAIQSIGRSGGAGEICVRITEMDSDVLIEVRDNGEGIPAGMINDLFRPLFTTKADGNGLGLSISRSIIAAHGGDIWAAAALQHGAAISFTLPSRPSLRDTG